MAESADIKVPVRMDGIEGTLHFDGFIIRHEDPSRPEVYHQVISLLHVSRLQYGVEYKSPWPLIIGIVLGAIGLFLMAENQDLGELGLLLLLAGITGFIIWAISANRLAIILETPNSKVAISSSGHIEQLRELYLRLETAWLVAQARLTKTFTPEPAKKSAEASEDAAE